MLQGMATVTEKLVMVPLVPSQSARIDASYNGSPSRWEHQCFTCSLCYV